MLPEDNSCRLNDLCGPLNANLHQLERHLAVQINNRGHHFQIVGQEQGAVTRAEQLIKSLYHSAEEEPLSKESVQRQLQKTSLEQATDRVQDPCIIKTKKTLIQARNANQKVYLDNMRSHDINFGIGPAGTGKTYLAVAAAVSALDHQLINRIVLVRPVVEAGERLGFLPGDLLQKVDPYLRPLHDALYEMLGFERVSAYIEQNIIEVAPLAFMRGRTLSGSFIILDEAQNTTTKQMKMFLTRLGFHSTVVVTGDITQIDLPSGTQSGLCHVMDVLKHTPGISFTFFSSKDAVRHPMVTHILNAYDTYSDYTSSDTGPDDRS